MKIVEDEMGGIKVGCFGEKSKKIWRLDGLSIGRFDDWSI
jgi:hypothetical protein